jgi:site-specific recombinase XerD
VEILVKKLRTVYVNWFYKSTLTRLFDCGKTNAMRNEQLPLFPPAGTRPKRLAESEVSESLKPTPIAVSSPLAPTSSLAAAITAYHGQMKTLGLSQHTIQAFGGDLNLFSKRIGASLPVNEITTETLNQFLNWLRYERGVPCKPKSYQRRLTTLKVFFAWLKQIQVIAEDPAVSIAHIPVTTALPEILYDDQINKLLGEARRLLETEKADARPLLLATLLLSTGIKKSEAMAIRPSDIDIQPSGAVLYIRYDDAKKRHKERKIKLSSEFAATLPHYITQYHPRELLFDCTPRNLEYVLSDMAKATGLGNTVSFESLRWTCAVQDYKKGVSDDHIRQKLGLSTITWEEDAERLKRLASEPL